MQSVLERLPLGGRVAVIRLRSLGDCVLTAPALEILKHARPDLEIAVVVEDPFAAVFRGNPDVARILPPRAAELSKFRPELCVNLHGGTRSFRLTLASRARFRAGFAHFWGSWLYNVRIPTAQQILEVDRKVHTAEHLASAIFHLGAPIREVPPARLFAEPLEAKHAYAVFHPVASLPEKTWPADGFLRIADYVRETWELDPVFVAGWGEDLDAFTRHPCAAGAPLEETKSLLAGAALFVGNDSGPAHMAAALGVPAAVIFGASDAVIWGPWKAMSQTIVADGPIASIKPARVMQAIDLLLKVPA